MNPSEFDVKYVGTGLPILLHAELTKIAAKEKITLTGLLRQTLCKKVEDERAAGREEGKTLTTGQKRVRR